jgi:hypothetical protein
MGALGAADRLSLDSREVYCSLNLPSAGPKRQGRGAGTSACMLAALVQRVLHVHRAVGLGYGPYSRTATMQAVDSSRADATRACMCHLGIVVGCLVPSLCAVPTKLTRCAARSAQVVGMLYCTPLSTVPAVLCCAALQHVTALHLLCSSR